MKKEITVRELFFYMFFSIMFGMRMWGIYEGKPIYGVLLLIGFAFWGLSMIMTEHTVLEYAVCVALLAVAGLVYVNTGEKGLLLYFALMLGMKGICIEKLFKVGIVVGASGMACITFLAAFGFIEDVAYIQSRSFVGDVFRRSLGFPHPNTLSSSLVIISMLIMYIIGYEDKPKVWKASIALFIIALYLYFYSGSRTGILITGGYFFLNLVYAYRNKIGIIEKVVAVLVMPLLWVISIVAPALLHDDVLQIMARRDATLAARWTIGNYYLKYNKLSLFGRRLVNPEAKPYGIDMAQLYLFLQLGLIAFVIVSILWIMLLYFEIKDRLVKEFVITITMLVMGITDPFLYNIGFKNLAFVFMGVCFYEIFGNMKFKCPEIMHIVVQPLKVGSKGLKLPNIFGSSCARLGRKSIVVTCLCAVVLAVVAIGLYYMTPDPKLVLADRKPGEHELYEELIGNQYTEQDVREIKAEGDLVLNYTDDSELMYTHYTTEDNAVVGGYYAPMAGKMEKIRKSVSIFFWGILVVILIQSFLDKNHKEETV